MLQLTANDVFLVYPVHFRQMDVHSVNPARRAFLRRVKERRHAPNVQERKYQRKDRDRAPSAHWEPNRIWATLNVLTVQMVWELDKVDCAKCAQEASSARRVPLSVAPAQQVPWLRLDRPNARNARMALRPMRIKAPAMKLFRAKLVQPARATKIACSVHQVPSALNLDSKVV